MSKEVERRVTATNPPAPRATAAPPRVTASSQAGRRRRLAVRWRAAARRAMAGARPEGGSMVGSSARVWWRLRRVA